MHYKQNTNDYLLIENTMLKNIVTAAEFEALEKRIAAMEKEFPTTKKTTPKKSVTKDYKNDLTVISGIGPKLQAKLHVLGVRSIATISQWTDTEAKAMSEKIGFPERAIRENWMGQAKRILGN